MNFEQKLIKKYPSLFEEKDGKPVEPMCGIDCPKGWETIIDNLCQCIVYRTDCTSRCIVNKDNKVKYGLYKLFLYVKHKVRTYYSPFESHYLEKNRENIKETNRFKVLTFLNRINSNYFGNIYIQVPASPPVRIAQVKEKFGTLRFYYDGGDEHIAGMVELAEHLSSITCQETGKSGSLHKKGSWYMTLSSRKAKELGYTNAKL